MSVGSLPPRRRRGLVVAGVPSTQAMAILAQTARRRPRQLRRHRLRLRSAFFHMEMAVSEPPGASSVERRGGASLARLASPSTR